MGDMLITGSRGISANISILGNRIMPLSVLEEGRQIPVGQRSCLVRWGFLWLVTPPLEQIEEDYSTGGYHYLLPTKRFRNTRTDTTSQFTNGKIRQLNYIRLQLASACNLPPENDVYLNMNQSTSYAVESRPADARFTSEQPTNTLQLAQSKLTRFFHALPFTAGVNANLTGGYRQSWAFGSSSVFIKTTEKVEIDLATKHTSSNATRPSVLMLRTSCCDFDSTTTCYDTCFAETTVSPASNSRFQRCSDIRYFGLGDSFELMIDAVSYLKQAISITVEELVWTSLYSNTVISSNEVFAYTAAAGMLLSDVTFSPIATIDSYIVPAGRLIAAPNIEANGGLVAIKDHVFVKAQFARTISVQPAILWLSTNSYAADAEVVYPDDSAAYKAKSGYVWPPSTKPAWNGRAAYTAGNITKYGDPLLAYIALNNIAAPGEEDPDNDDPATDTTNWDVWDAYSPDIDTDNWDAISFYNQIEVAGTNDGTSIAANTILLIREYGNYSTVVGEDLEEYERWYSYKALVDTTIADCFDLIEMQFKRLDDLSVYDSNKLELLCAFATLTPSYMGDWESCPSRYTLSGTSTGAGLNERYFWYAGSVVRYEGAYYTNALSISTIEQAIVPPDVSDDWEEVADFLTDVQGTYPYGSALSEYCSIITMEEIQELFDEYPVNME
jgi:hypothetical protein